MKTYEIEQTETAVILWTGKAESKESALDSMAREAGYRDYAHACKDTSSDGVEVREVVDHESYHVTKVGSEGVFGHSTRRCDESGCAGTQLYLGDNDTFPDVEVGDVVGEQ